MRELLYICGLVVTIFYSGQAQVIPAAIPQDSTGINDSANIIKGRIIDAANRPLPGVSVSSNDSTITVLTNDDGAFELKYEQEPDTLRLYKTGYNPRKVALLGRKELTTFVTGGPPVSPGTAADSLNNIDLDSADVGKEAVIPEDSTRTPPPETP
jgi:hypothetical protein